MCLKYWWEESLEVGSNGSEFPGLILGQISLSLLTVSPVVAVSSHL
jgi:hypothetical protein